MSSSNDYRAKDADRPKLAAALFFPDGLAIVRDGINDSDPSMGGGWGIFGG